MKHKEKEQVKQDQVKFKVSKPKHIVEFEETCRLLGGRARIEGLNYICEFENGDETFFQGLVKFKEYFSQYRNLGITPELRRMKKRFLGLSSKIVDKVVFSETGITIETTRTAKVGAIRPKTLEPSLELFKYRVEEGSGEEITGKIRVKPIYDEFGGILLLETHAILLIKPDYVRKVDEIYVNLIKSMNETVNKHIVKLTTSPVATATTTTSETTTQVSHPQTTREIKITKENVFNKRLEIMKEKNKQSLEEVLEELIKLYDEEKKRRMLYV